jgi:hypothetical protein
VKRFVIVGAGFGALLVLSGCVAQIDRATDTPEVVATSTPVPPATPEPPTPSPPPLPSPTPELPLPSPTPVPPLFLDILSPTFGSIIRTETVSVVGFTLPRVLVKVNSTVVRADGDGRFEANVTLFQGQNIIAIVLTGADGRQIRDFITVTYSPPPTPTPPPFFLDVEQPGNLSIVGDQPVLVAGRTSPSARVTVNGVGVPVDGDGRFSTLVGLAAGNNVIQVLAVDPQGSTRRSTISIIYDP